MKKKGGKKTKKGKSVKSVNSKFKNYEEKIDRLRELEREMRVLDPPKKFEVEVNIIKSKLKDPSSIDEIERRISKLKRKMAKMRKKTAPIKRIRNKYSELKEEEIPKLKTQITRLKKDKELEEQKRLQTLKVARMKENRADEEYKKLQNQIRNLKYMFEERKKKEEDRKADADVSNLVDERYIDFINNLKKDLTEEESKEVKKGIGEKTAKIELDKREFFNKVNKKLREKSLQLDNEKRRYYKRISEEGAKKIHREIESKEKILKKRFHDRVLAESRRQTNERRSRLKEEFEKKLNEAINKEKSKVEGIYNSRKRILEGRYNKQMKDIKLHEQKLMEGIQAQKNRLERTKQELKNKYENLRKKEEIAGLRMNRLRKQLDEEKVLIEREESSFEKSKAGYIEAIELKKNALSQDFSKIKKAERKKFNEQKEILRKKLLEEDNRKLKVKLNAEKKILHDSLEKEFLKKLQEEIDKQRGLSQKQLNMKKKENERKIREVHRHLHEKEKTLREMRKTLEDEKKTIRELLTGRKGFEKKLKMADAKKIGEITEKLHTEMDAELIKKETELKKKLQDEFNKKIQDNIQKQKDDLEKRRSALEADIKKNISLMLK